jgi:hypothetical protein
VIDGEAVLLGVRVADRDKHHRKKSDALTAVTWGTGAPIAGRSLLPVPRQSGSGATTEETINGQVRNVDQ